jgi:hypothetical protein
MDCESVESSEKGVHSGTGKSPEKMQNGRLCNSRSKKSPEKMQNGKLCNSRSIESPEKMQNGRLCNSRSKKSPEKMQNGRLCIPRAWNLQRRLQNSRCAFQGVETLEKMQNLCPASSCSHLGHCWLIGQASLWLTSSHIHIKAHLITMNF